MFHCLSAWKGLLKILVLTFKLLKPVNVKKTVSYTQLIKLTLFVNLVNFTRNHPYFYLYFD